MGDDPSAPPYRQASLDRLGRTLRTFAAPRRVRAVGVSLGASRTAVMRIGAVEVPLGRSAGRPWTRSQPGETVELCERGLRVRARTGVLELTWEQIVAWRDHRDGDRVAAIELTGVHGEQLRFGREVRDLGALFALVESARATAAGDAARPPATAPVDDRRCVVCQRPLRGEAVYANDWERVRKKLPCCTRLCAEAFDADQHWMPSPVPAPAGPEDQPRLRTLARERLAGGDEARPVVRELLIAGLDPSPLRALIAEAHEEVRAARAQQRRALLSFLLRGRARRALAEEERTDASFAAAVADLDDWIARAAAGR